MALRKNTSTSCGFQFTHNGKIYDFASIYVSKYELLDTNEVKGAPLSGIGRNSSDGELATLLNSNSSTAYGPDYIFGDYDSNWNSPEEYRRGRWSYISIGTNHAAGIIDGTIYIWGSDNQRQQGQASGSSYATVGTPNILTPPSGERWKIVECGNFNTVAITESGKLFGWGYNKYGQSNFTSRNNAADVVTVPMQIGTATGYTYAYCGYYSTYLLKDGILYQMGNKAVHLSSGITDIADANAISNGPQLLNTGNYQHRRFKKVIAPKTVGTAGAMALLEDGRVITFGYMPDRFRAVGGTSFSDDLNGYIGVKPQYIDNDGNIEFLEDCVDIACENATFVALRQDGTLWGWGDNGYGQLSLPASGGQAIALASYAVLMNNKKTNWSNYGQPDNGIWQKIGCSSGTTYAIKSDGQLWVTGRNDYGQCGNANSGSGNFVDGWNRASQYRNFYNKISCGQYSSLLI